MSVKHKKTVLFFENLGAMQMLSQMQQLKHLRIKNCLQTGYEGDCHAECCR